MRLKYQFEIGLSYDVPTRALGFTGDAIESTNEGDEAMSVNELELRHRRPDELMEAHQRMASGTEYGRQTARSKRSLALELLLVALLAAALIATDPAQIVAQR